MSDKVSDSQFFCLLVVSSFNYIKIYALSVYKHAVLAAFRIYGQRGEDVAKKGGWRPCISHGNYIADHGKSWENDGIEFLNFSGSPVLCVLRQNFFID